MFTQGFFIFLFTPEPQNQLNKNAVVDTRAPAHPVGLRSMSELWLQAQ